MQSLALPFWLPAIGHETGFDHPRARDLVGSPVDVSAKGFFAIPHIIERQADSVRFPRRHIRSGVSDENLVGIAKQHPAVTRFLAGEIPELGACGGLTAP